MPKGAIAMETLEYDKLNKICTLSLLLYMKKDFVKTANCLLSVYVFFSTRDQNGPGSLS